MAETKKNIRKGIVELCNDIMRLCKDMKNATRPYNRLPTEELWWTREQISEAADKIWKALEDVR